MEWAHRKCKNSQWMSMPTMRNYQTHSFFTCSCFRLRLCFCFLFFVFFRFSFSFFQRIFLIRRIIIIALSLFSAQWMYLIQVTWTWKIRLKVLHATLIRIKLFGCILCAPALALSLSLHYILIRIVCAFDNLEATQLSSARPLPNRRFSFSFTLCELESEYIFFACRLN